MTMTAAPAAPRLDSHVTTDAGRRVAYAEWGDPAGSPVLLLHRAPGSRLLDPDPAATAAAGARLVTMDRPGYGGTDPVDEPSFAAVAEDAVAVAGALGLDGVAVVGWSGGGQMAVPAAAALGDRVRSVSIACAPAPHDEVPWLPEPMEQISALIRSDPAAGLAAAREVMGALTDPEIVLAADDSASDRATRARPGVADALRAMYAEAARQGGNPFDIVAGSLPGPLPLGDLGAPARLWYGDDDAAVGVEHGRWYAERLDRAELTVVAGAGHLLPMDHWAAILAAALAP